MSTPFISILRPLPGSRVQPGDVITAELINSILARLEALEGEVPTQTLPTFPTFTLPTFTLPTLTFPTFQPTFTFPTFTFPTFTTFPTFGTLPTFTTAGPTFTTFPTFGTVPTFGTIGPTFTTFPTFGTFPTFTTFGPTFAGVTAAPTLGPGGGIIGLGLAQPADTVRVVPGIGREEERLLAGAGITSVRELADTDSVRVAETLRVEPNEAAGLIGAARSLIGPR